MPAYPTLPAVFGQVPSDPSTFTSVFGMGTGGAHLDKTPANKKFGASIKN